MGSVNDWMERAACKGMDVDIFVPVRGGDTQRAKRVCEGCPVREECRDYALSDPSIQGVWGGLSVRGRENLREKRPQTPKGEPIPHGTNRGWAMHLYRLSEPCDACRSAHSEDVRLWRHRMKQAV